MQEKVRMANAQQFWLLSPGLASLGIQKPSLLHFLNCFSFLSRYVLNNWNWAFVAPSQDMGVISYFQFLMSQFPQAGSLLTFVLDINLPLFLMSQFPQAGSLLLSTYLCCVQWPKPIRRTTTMTTALLTLTAAATSTITPTTTATCITFNEAILWQHWLQASSRWGKDYIR